MKARRTHRGGAGKAGRCLGSERGDEEGERGQGRGQRGGRGWEMMRGTGKRDARKRKVGTEFRRLVI